jgi:hypothetical protein
MAGGSTRSSPSKENAQTHTTPNLVWNESPQDLQNRQGTTAAASTSDVSATTATMVD